MAVSEVKKPTNLVSDVANGLEPWRRKLLEIEREAREELKQKQKEGTKNGSQE